MVLADDARIFITGGINAGGYLERNVIFNIRDNTYVQDVCIHTHLLITPPFFSKAIRSPKRWLDTAQ